MSQDLFFIIPVYTQAQKDDLIFDIKSYDYRSEEQRKEIEEVRKEQSIYTRSKNK